MQLCVSTACVISCWDNYGCGGRLFRQFPGSGLAKHGKAYVASYVQMVAFIGEFAVVCLAIFGVIYSAAIVGILTIFFEVLQDHQSYDGLAPQFGFGAIAVVLWLTVG